VPFTLANLTTKSFIFIGSKLLPL